ncbi:hypothetical protein SUDANB121_01186 [Nocardiopsis dassonvillei]
MKSRPAMSTGSSYARTGEAASAVPMTRVRFRVGSCRQPRVVSSSIRSPTSNRSTSARRVAGKAVRAVSSTQDTASRSPRISR